jgi:hypothetical protein
METVRMGETVVDEADGLVVVGEIAEAAGVEDGLAVVGDRIADAAGRAGEDTNFFATDLHG